MALFSDKSWDHWISEYALSHQHPVNKLSHKIGIPLIVLSLILLPFSFVGHSLWIISSVLFIAGWLFQFIGHYYEQKPPEFFKDWRFLFVGVRWWLRKL